MSAPTVGASADTLVRSPASHVATWSDLNSGFTNTLGVPFST